MARKGRGKQKRLADMSLPPEKRGRRSGGRARSPVPAQLQHGNSAHARSRRRDGERQMERERSDEAAVLDGTEQPEQPGL